jgi:hypothetical protein
MATQTSGRRSAFTAVAFFTRPRWRRLRRTGTAAASNKRAAIICQDRTLATIFDHLRLRPRRSQIEVPFKSTCRCIWLLPLRPPQCERPSEFQQRAVLIRPAMLMALPDRPPRPAPRQPATHRVLRGQIRPSNGAPPRWVGAALALVPDVSAPESAGTVRPYRRTNASRGNGDADTLNPMTNATPADAIMTIAMARCRP